MNDSIYCTSYSQVFSDSVMLQSYYMWLVGVVFIVLIWSVFIYDYYRTRRRMIIKEGEKIEKW